jgi:hypothetical protein
MMTSTHSHNGEVSADFSSHSTINDAQNAKSAKPDSIAPGEIAIGVVIGRASSSSSWKARFTHS